MPLYNPSTGGGGAPSGAAGGDLGSTYPNPTVTATHLGSALPVAQGGTGATAQNFAGLLTPTAVKTSGYTAAAGDFVPVDTTSASVTITLPTAPADLTVIGVKQVTRGGTNTVTVAAGGSDVFNKTGGAASATLTLLAQGAIYQYKATGAIWYVYADDLPLSQTDARYAQLSNNLSDVTAATARTNLGLGTAATQATGTFAQVANNLSDVTAASARTNLGLGTSATQASTVFCQTANNLSDVGTRQTALNNLAGAQTANQVLAGNGTNVTVRALAAPDLPLGTLHAYSLRNVMP